MPSDNSRRVPGPSRGWFGVRVFGLGLGFGLRVSGLMVLGTRVSERIRAKPPLELGYVSISKSPQHLVIIRGPILNKRGSSKLAQLEA